MPDQDRDERWRRFVDWEPRIIEPAHGESAAGPIPEHMHYYARHGKLKAPPGKFKITLADTFDHTDVSLGAYGDRDQVLRVAREHSGSMKVCFVYDDRGRVVGEFGTP